jgi:hypothetical protein
MARKKWKTFERLVTAIHVAEQRGAAVRWDEKIGGRQFDVTIRFKSGFYEYLTVVECKEYKKAVAAEKVEALVTKARDVRADKAIMVSSSGYQKGALTVARRHGVKLFTLKNLAAIKDSDLTGGAGVALNLYAFTFHAAKEKGVYIIPEEPGVLRSLMRDIRVEGPGVSTCPEELMLKFGARVQHLATHEPQTFDVRFPPGTVFVHPNTLAREEVSAFSFEFCIVPAEGLEEKGLGADLYLTASVYEFEDSLTKERTVVDASRLRHGFDTVLQPGKFYTNPNLGWSYYCERVSEVDYQMCLVESYAFGKLIQCQYIQGIEYAGQFVEVTDEAEVMRLRSMYEKYKEGLP